MSDMAHMAISLIGAIFLICNCWYRITRLEKVVSVLSAKVERMR